MSDPKPEALTDAEYARFVATMWAAPADANWDRGSLLVLCDTIDADRQRIAALESSIAAGLALCEEWIDGNDNACSATTVVAIHAALLCEGDGASPKSLLAEPYKAPADLDLTKPIVPRKPPVGRRGTEFCQTCHGRIQVRCAKGCTQYNEPSFPMSGGNAIDHTALIARLRDDAFATPVRFPIKRSAVLAAHAIEECDSMRKALIALCDGGPNGAYHGRYSYDMDAFIEKVRAIIEGGGKVHDE